MVRVDRVRDRDCAVKIFEFDDTVAPAAGSNVSNNVPEPASLLLAITGMSALLLRQRRDRRPAA